VVPSSRRIDRTARQKQSKPSQGRQSLQASGHAWYMDDSPHLRHFLWYGEQARLVKTVEVYAALARVHGSDRRLHNNWWSVVWSLSTGSPAGHV
jgi:hypothetical protein